MLNINFLLESASEIGTPFGTHLRFAEEGLNSAVKRIDSIGLSGGL